MTSDSGLVVKSNVAIVGPRVRFTADALFLLSSISCPSYTPRLRLRSVETGFLLSMSTLFGLCYLVPWTEQSSQLTIYEYDVRSRTIVEVLVRNMSEFRGGANRVGNKNHFDLYRTVLFIKVGIPQFVWKEKYRSISLA